LSFSLRREFINRKAVRIYGLKNYFEYANNLFRNHQFLFFCDSKLFQVDGYETKHRTMFFGAAWIFSVRIVLEMAMVLKIHFRAVSFYAILIP